MAFSQAIITGSGWGSNINPATFLGATMSSQNGKGILVNFPNQQALLRINLPVGTDWTPYTHLQADVQNMGSKPEPFFFAIASSGQWCFAEVVLAPNSESKFIIPLDTANQLGLTYPLANLPTPPNNSAIQVFTNTPVTKSAVCWLQIFTPDASAATSILIHDLRPVTSPIPTSNLVDKYGQQAQTTWSTKINTDSDLVTRVAARTLSGTYGFSADSYGGVNGTAQAGSATGLWHTAKQNGRWFIIDPLGNRFFSTGIVNAGNGTPAIVTGRESAFPAGALPDQGGDYKDHYTTGYGPSGPVLTYNFYTSNIQHRVGATWKDTLLAETVSRMKTWGFNTLGPSSNRLLEMPGQEMSFSEIIQITGNFPWINDPTSGFQMPDIYDPAWAPAVTASLQPKVQQLQGNSHSIGLFVDNELPWAKTYAAANARYGLCEDILLCPATQPAKIGFVNWLQQRYAGDIFAFNSSWQTSLGSFTDLLIGNLSLPATVPPGMASDMQAFILQYTRTYLQTIRQSLTNLGYQGMYLGPRLLYYTPEVLQACKENCDLISINDYEILASYHHADVQAFDAPVMISEVGFDACDQGRTPAYPSLLTEKDRSQFYKRYMGDALGWTNLVGVQYYKWEDDVISGRFFDGNNACLGLISIADVPYWTTVDAAASANMAFQNKLLIP